MSNLVRALVNRQITVQSNGLKISGRLLHVSDSSRRPDHKPCVLVLQTLQGFCLVRDWTLIAFSGGP